MINLLKKIFYSIIRKINGLKFIYLFLLFFFIYYLFLLGYDLYFKKNYYIFICDKVYCIDNIEYKDYASVVATLIGSAFVFYSLFTWKDNFKFNLTKNDIERFRFATHALMKNLDTQFDSFSDQYEYINEAKNKGTVVNDFNTTVAHYNESISECKTKRLLTIDLFNDFRFERKYFVLHGGKTDRYDFDVKHKNFINSLDELHCAFIDNKVDEFLRVYPICKAKKDVLDKEFINLIFEIHKILRK